LSWGYPRNSIESLGYTFLKPISWGWKSVVQLRNLAYSKGYLKSYRASAPVISIGNISVGGTGKTPVTIDLAKRLIANGKKIAILSRGYRRKSSQKTLVVSDGKNILCNAYNAGDEPYLIAKSVPEAVVVVGAKRSVSASLATTLYNIDVILLDDGYQHRALARDIEIVLIDYNSYPDRDNMVPAGRLREPVSALERASVVIITKIPEHPDTNKLSYLDNVASKFAPRAKQYYCNFLPTGFVSLDGERSLRLEDLRDVPVAAFCGIARGEEFFQQLSSLGLKVVVGEEFPDHHWYSKQDVEYIQHLAEKTKAKFVITTAKDAVRLKALTNIDNKIFESFWCLEMSVTWLNDNIPLGNISTTHGFKL
jgi:tetraacyldisaccharide 4'-kinase